MIYYLMSSSKLIATSNQYTSSVASLAISPPSIHAIEINHEIDIDLCFFFNTCGWVRPNCHNQYRVELYSKLCISPRFTRNNKKALKQFGKAC